MLCGKPLRIIFLFLWFRLRVWCLLCRDLCEMEWDCLVVFNHDLIILARQNFREYGNRVLGVISPYFLNACWFLGFSLWCGKCMHLSMIHVLFFFFPWSEKSANMEIVLTVCWEWQGWLIVWSCKICWWFSFLLCSTLVLTTQDLVECLWSSSCAIYSFLVSFSVITLWKLCRFQITCSMMLAVT